MLRTTCRFVGLILLFCVSALIGAQAPAGDPMELYRQMKAFKLGASSAHVENFTLDRDRLRFVLTGDVFFAEPVGGGVYGAVFIGQGRITTEPATAWEAESIKRFTNTTTVDATFTRAVLRFTDDTADKFAGKPAAPAALLAEAQRHAQTFNERLTRETGLNMEARMVQAVTSKESPGVFLAEMDGGNRGRFSAVLDHQMRIPTTIFGINGGEKSLIYKYEGLRFGVDVWAASYSEQDFQKGIASYGDVFDLVSIPNYRMEIDLRDPGNWLRMQVGIDVAARTDNVRVLPLQLNDGLSEVDNVRRDKGVRVLSAELEGGGTVGVIQEPWENGVSLVLPAALAKGQTAKLNLKLEGRDSLWSWGARFHYPRYTSTWYPRHGYLARSKFTLTFRHDRNNRIASNGRRTREGVAQGNEWITEWVTDEPVALITFVCGPFERHTEAADVGGQKIPFEYYSPPGAIKAVKEDFLLAEMGNATRYFDNIFGAYPYGRLGAAYFPTSYGQGFPTLLLLPAEGYATPNEFAFLAHENAHQWWGNIVGWRSYRDQWLSEGFANYSGALYTGARMKPRDGLELLEKMRLELLEIATTSTGVAQTKVFATGPLILGTRLSSTRSLTGYSLVYNKGALVLRMLHFLLTPPDRPSDDTAFFAMMKDFVNRHRNAVATSESFMQVASEHFVKSPIGQRYGMKDLGWFLDQWVYQTALPSYEFNYTVEPRDGGAVLKGTLLQQNTPDDWFMILPLVAEFSGGRIARTTVHANGPRTNIEIRLPERPQRVRLDPDSWILSEKTSEKG